MITIKNVITMTFFIVYQIFFHKNYPNEEENKHEVIHTLMLEALRTHSASYTVDTYSTFRKRALQEKHLEEQFKRKYNIK